MKRTLIGTLLSLLFSSLVWASGGGNGVRNGGGAVQCIPGLGPVTLEYFEALREYPALSLVSGSVDPTSALLDRLTKIEPRLAMRVEDQLRRFFPLGRVYDDHPFDSMWDFGSPIDSSGFTRLLYDLRRRYPDYRFDPRFTDWAPILDFQLDTDLPAGCEYFQLLMYDGVRPRVWANRRVFEGLSVTQARLLALHEAFYAIGSREFGHRSSRLTRRLIVALIGEVYGNGAPRLTESRVAEFEDYRRSLARFESASPLRDAPGVYRAGRNEASCPVYTRVEFDGVAGIVETGIFLDSNRKRIRIRFSGLTEDAWRSARRECAFERVSRLDTERIDGELE